MKRFVITEQEKENILNQHKKMTDKGRRILDVDITPITLRQIKSQGLTPYYFNKDLDMVELTEPIKGKSYDTKFKEVFLLTPEEFKQITELSSNVKELIKLSLQKFEALKELIPSSLIAIMNKKG